ncbi:MAG: cytochrome c [Proteobacteria bacterium]|nr:cytochrome c [Pseudomonadota bacterium]MCP4919377.1 cytochrome c [Pseudomonadota bacterium]
MFSLLVSLSFAADADAGKTPYTTSCAACHGDKGDGAGPVGGALTPKPADFTSKEFQDGRTDAELAKAIKEGGAAVGKSPLMAAFGGTMTDEQIDDVVAYIRTFKPAE